MSNGTFSSILCNRAVIKLIKQHCMLSVFHKKRKNIFRLPDEFDKENNRVARSLVPYSDPYNSLINLVHTFFLHAGSFTSSFTHTPTQKTSLQLVLKNKDF